MGLSFYKILANRLLIWPFLIQIGAKKDREARLRKQREAYSIGPALREGLGFSALVKKPLEWRLEEYCRLETQCFLRLLEL